MPRHTEESGELYDDFVAALRQAAQVDGYAIRETYGQAQLLRIDGPRRAYINVRTDAKGGGWWGFTKNVEDDLKKRGNKWFFVLLESTPGEGYMLSDVEVASAKTRWDDGGRQYIIHPTILRDLWRFRGIESLWGRRKSRL